MRKVEKLEDKVHGKSRYLKFKQLKIKNYNLEMLKMKMNCILVYMKKYFMQKIIHRSKGPSGLALLHKWPLKCSNQKKSRQSSVSKQTKMTGLFIT